MKKLILAALAAVLPAAAEPNKDYPKVNDASWTEANGDRVIQLSVVVAAGTNEVWRTLTTSEGWKSYAVAFAAVDLQVGGIIETSYNPKAQLGDPNNIKNQIQAYVPGRILAFRCVQAPPAFEHKSEFFATSTLLELFPEAHGQTRVQLTAVGFRPGPAYDDLFPKFRWGDAYTLDKLRLHFAPEGGSGASEGASRRDKPSENNAEPQKDIASTPGLAQNAATESDPAHVDAQAERPLPWPKGIIPYDLSKLTDEQAAQARQAMKLWTETGANVQFIPHTTEAEYVYFTGKTDAGNNTPFIGYKKGSRQEVNITAFWWKQGPWMPAHELGHVLGFFHEHQRWDRDQHVTVHYEHIKPGREFDYNWVPRTNWIVATPTYDYWSIMHYRTCWASKCESECKDGVGTSPCAVLDPIGSEFDTIIGQWTDNHISKIDGEKLRLVYGTRPAEPR